MESFVDRSMDMLVEKYFFTASVVSSSYLTVHSLQLTL